MEGYIKIFRKKLEWRWFRDPSVAHLFEYRDMGVKRALGDDFFIPDIFRKA